MSLFINHFLQKLLTSGCMALGIVVLNYPALANPQNGVVGAGQVTIRGSDKKLDIIQHSDKAIIDWRSFDISKDEHTEFHQPSNKSIVLNRVNSKNASQIDGKLTANGNVIIVNQNGILFGNNASVDVNGLIASTADIDNDKFMQHNTLHFDKKGNPLAYVANAGQITAKESGLVGFVAPNVLNSGIISAKLGRVHLASGDTATLDLYGDGLMQVAVSDSVKSQLVANTGGIEADGGKIALTAAKGKQIVNSVINVQGALITQSVGVKNGEIVISAAKNPKKTSKVVVKAVMNASGRKSGERGGKITVTGDNIALLDGTLLDTSGDTGKSFTTSNKKISDYREGAAGGDIKIGGDYLGGGSTPTANNLYVGSHVLVFNDALNSGDAGRTILWSDNQTQFYGNIYARALGGKTPDLQTWNATLGGNNGDGGFVETSGHGKLEVGGYVNLTSSNGTRGTYFLDPANIAIYGNVNPTFVSTDSSIDLAAHLKLWLDSSDTNNVVLTYNSLGTTATGVIGTNTITVNDNTGLTVGSRIRLGGAGAVTTAATVGADTYTISSIVGTTVTLSSNLTAGYVGSSIYESYVSQLTDKSGFGNNVTQATAGNMPLWISNKQNGLGVTFFNGDLFNYLENVTMATGGSLSVYTVAANQRLVLTWVDPVLTTMGSGNIGGIGVATYNQWLNLGQRGLYPDNPDTGQGGAMIAYKNSSSTPVTLDLGEYAILSLVGTGFTNRTTLRLGEFTNGSFPGTNDVSEVFLYDTNLSASAQDLVNQYQSVKWDIALNPPGTGATEAAKATAADGYSAFTTRYLERLSQSANISLQATNNISLDLQGDNLNFATAGRSLTITAGNQITTASNGTITTNGGDISLNATNGILVSHNLALNSNGGNINFSTTNSPATFSNAITLSGNTSINTGSGTTTFSNTVNGNYNLTVNSGDISFAAALGGVTPLGAVSLTSTNSLSLPSISSASLSAQTTGAAADITIPVGKILTTSGAGTPLTLASAHNLINNSGSGALVAPAGRWLVYSTNPASDTIGSLSNGFRRFTCSYGGACPALGAGNGLLYSYTPNLTITPNGAGASIIYGDAVPDLSGYSYTLTGYLGTDSADDVLTGSVTAATTTYTAGSNVGTYNITASGTRTSALGYGFIYADNAVPITVSTRSLSVNADTKSKTYGDADPALTYSLTSGSLYGADAFSGALGRAAGETVLGGPYAILQNTLTAGANYTITYTGANLTINKKDISVTGLTASNKTYDTTTSATLGGTAGVSALGADMVTLNGVAVGNFLDPNIGLGKTVIVSGLSLAGIDAGNYNIAAIGLTADITAIPTNNGGDNSNPTTDKPPVITPVTPPPVIIPVTTPSKPPITTPIHPVVRPTIGRYNKMPNTVVMVSQDATIGASRIDEPSVSNTKNKSMHNSFNRSLQKDFSTFNRLLKVSSELAKKLDLSTEYLF